MKFFAFFAFAAIIAVAAAGSYTLDEYEALESQQKPIAAELARPERSYGGGSVKCGKAVVVGCSPIVQKVKCKGGY